MNARILRPVFGLGFRIGKTAELALALVVLVLLAIFLPHTTDSLVALGVGVLPIFGMYVDAQLVASDAQALTATAYSTNTVDTGNAANAIDVGEPMAWCVTVDVAAKTSNSDETYQFLVVQSANADLSSHDTLYSSDTTFVSRSFLTAGKRFYLPLPEGLKTKRYLGLRYVLGGTGPTLTVTAHLVPLRTVQNNPLYTSGLTITS
jgi:hypothetical protein